MEQLVENHQGFLLEASKIIAEADSLNDGLKILSQDIVKSLDTTFCCFMLLNKITNQFQMIASGFTDRKYQTNWTPAQQKNCLPIQETILEHFFLEGKPVIYPENKNGFEILNCLECTANIPQQLKSAIIVPLKVKEKALGLCIIGEMRSSERKLFPMRKFL